MTRPASHAGGAAALREPKAGGPHHPCRGETAPVPGTLGLVGVYWGGGGLLWFGGAHLGLAAMAPRPPPVVQCGPPPTVSNARAFGKPKQRYEIGSVTRYQCRRGFVQRHSPIVRCREDGTWEPPQLSCRPGERGAPPDSPARPQHQPPGLSLPTGLLVSPSGLAQPPDD